MDIRCLWKDESGVTTIEMLVLTVAGALLVIIAFAGMRGGVRDAATQLGNKIKNSTSGTGTGW